MRSDHTQFDLLFILMGLHIWDKLSSMCSYFQKSSIYRTQVILKNKKNHNFRNHIQIQRFHSRKLCFLNQILYFNHQKLFQFFNYKNIFQSIHQIFIFNLRCSYSITNFYRNKFLRLRC